MRTRVKWLCLATPLVATAFILSGCGSSHKKDGPPRYNVDVTKIPNAIPKPEPLAKYGNMRSYKVFGKRYYPMRSRRSTLGFQQTGTASWYGTKFHERRTSSGEPYDMLGMTAAHKTLPLPTYVEVTNLRNNKKIIVKVNDRGPFSSNRIIDLSYAAAKKLGMLAKGTTKVRIRAINPYTWAKNKGKAAAQKLRRAGNSIKHYAEDKLHKRRLYLQTGAFSRKSYADKMKNKLASKMNYPVKVHNPARNSKFYKVRIGPIKDMSSADKLTRQLNKSGITPIIVRGA